MYIYLYRQIEYMYYYPVLFSSWNSLSFVTIVVFNCQQYVTNNRVSNDNYCCTRGTDIRASKTTRQTTRQDSDPHKSECVLNR